MKEGTKKKNRQKKKIERTETELYVFFHHSCLFSVLNTWTKKKKKCLTAQLNNLKTQLFVVDCSVSVFQKRSPVYIAASV